MRTSKALAVFLTCLMVPGCSSLQVSVDYDPAARFAELRSYDWAPIPQEKAGDPVIDTDTLLRQRIVSAVDGELARRGYRKTPHNPDFLTTFFFTRQRAWSTSVYPYYPFYGGFFGGPYYGYWGGWYYPGYYGTYLREYDEGLLVIDFLDPASRKLLWRGMVRDYLRFQETPETRDLRINEAVVAVLQRFPPR